MSIPFGHGIQYPHPVHPTFKVSWMSFFTASINAKSSSVNSPVCTSDAMRTFSRIISSEFIPESTHVTSGCSHSHRKASSAGVRFLESFAIRFLAFSGRRSTNLPPRKGSMIITGMPFFAAACNPARPACVCSSI